MNEVKLSRKELYNLVWTESMLSLSKRFNISDVGLRKICRKMKIPTPPVGHWQRVQYTTSIRIPKLPEKYSGKQEVTLSLRPADKLVNLGHITMLNRLQKELENDPSLNFQVPPKLSKPDKLIKEARTSLREKKNRSSYHGVITCSGLNIIVSPKNVGRALKFMDILIKVLHQRGHDIHVNYKTTDVIVFGERLKIRLQEKLKQVVIKDSNWIQYHANGILSFKIGDYHVAEFHDGIKPIEENLPRILGKLELLGKKQLEERLAWEKKEAERKEKERIQKELEQRKVNELANFKQLLQRSKRWRQTAALRAFIDVIKEKAIKYSTTTEELEGWITWASQKTDWYDPLIESEDDLLREVDRESLTVKKKVFIFG
jgi:hypothetical protein